MKVGAEAKCRSRRPERRTTPATAQLPEEARAEAPTTSRDGGSATTLPWRRLQLSWTRLAIVSPAKDWGHAYR